MTFPVLELTASVSELLSTRPTPDGRLAVMAEPTDRAVILGSTQSESDVKSAWLGGRGITVARRKSGGGAVFVEPESQIWLDVFVPAKDERFDADVARATHWFGELWRSALITCGAPEAIAVHRGAMVHRPSSRSVCFLGLGPGEVTLNERKVVGISQRRDRTGAWLYSLACLRLNAQLFASAFDDSQFDQVSIEHSLIDGITTMDELGATKGLLKAALSQELMTT